MVHSLNPGRSASRQIAPASLLPKKERKCAINARMDAKLWEYQSIIVLFVKDCFVYVFHVHSVWTVISRVFVPMLGPR